MRNVASVGRGGLMLWTPMVLCATESNTKVTAHPVLAKAGDCEPLLATLCILHPRPAHPAFQVLIQANPHALL